MASGMKWMLGAAAASAALAVSPSVAHGAAGTAYSPLDEYALQSSIQGDRFEIAGGRLARSRAATPAIRALGARLVKDHSKSLTEAVDVAKRLGISVPSTPTPSQEWELQTISRLSGLPFDAAYGYLEIQDHKQDIEETKTEIFKGLNPSVRGLARTDLPTLRTHLKLSKQAFWKVPGRWPPE